MLKISSYSSLLNVNCSNIKMEIISHITGLWGGRKKYSWQHRFELRMSTLFFFLFFFPINVEGLGVLGFCICGFNQLQIENYFRSSVGNLWIPSVNLSHMGIFNSSRWGPLTTPPPPSHSRVSYILKQKPTNPMVEMSHTWSCKEVLNQSGVPSALLDHGLFKKGTGFLCDLQKHVRQSTSVD